MIGSVDDRDRALIEIQVHASLKSSGVPVVAWIDTAFDGHLVFSDSLIRQLGLKPLSKTEATLADGTEVVLQSYVCFIEWFGTVVPLQVITSDCKMPLLGTGLLANRVLHVDYQRKQLSLT